MTPERQDPDRGTLIVFFLLGVSVGIFIVLATLEVVP
jgi:F0F1-type ATP synthase assembly protein I